MAWNWAQRNNVPKESFPADWERHGKSAGPTRNFKMLREACPSLVVAFPGGKGTAHMVGIAKAKGVEVLEVSAGKPASPPLTGKRRWQEHKTTSEEVK